MTYQIVFFVRPVHGMEISPFEQQYLHTRTLAPAHMHKRNVTTCMLASVRARLRAHTHARVHSQ